jgi:Uma2 family endonuclease
MRFVIQPDIVFYKSGRKGLIGDKSLWGPPDLIIEILAPSTREQDIKTKKGLYSRFEVREYWIVDPTREIEFWRVNWCPRREFIRNRIIISPALPGFRLPLRKIFQTWWAGRRDFVLMG